MVGESDDLTSGEDRPLTAQSYLAAREDRISSIQERGVELMSNFDWALRIAAVLLTFAAACFVLILGIFASVIDTSTALLVGMGIVLCGLWVILLMIMARLAPRWYSSVARSPNRKAFLVTVIVASLGGAMLVFGTWEGVKIYMQRPVYQDAAIAPTTPSSF